MQTVAVGFSRYDTPDGVLVTARGFKMAPAVGRMLWTEDEVRDLTCALIEASSVQRETGLTGADLTWELERRWPHLADDRMYRLAMAGRIVTMEIRGGAR